MNTNNLSQNIWKVCTDGASRGNPGIGGIGFVVYRNDLLINKSGYLIGKVTNNQAEYFACLAAITYIIHDSLFSKNDKIIIYADSLLMIKQLLGEYKIKNENLKILHTYIINLLKNITWKAIHISREKNSIADNLANKGIDNEIPIPPYLNDYMFIINSSNGDNI